MPISYPPKKLKKKILESQTPPAPPPQKKGGKVTHLIIFPLKIKEIKEDVKAEV